MLWGIYNNKINEFCGRYYVDETGVEGTQLYAYDTISDAIQELMYWDKDDSDGCIVTQIPNDTLIYRPF